MGRELRRVPLDFDWPINKTWDGFVNPLYAATKCKACDGTGYSPEGRRMKDLWYGHAPFKPEDRGSVPFTPEDDEVAAFAKRNVNASPEFYGRDRQAIEREARRLCHLWNGHWCHHLNEDDVSALIEAERLYDFTHTFDTTNRWQPKSPPYTPTPREVNLWSISGLGHGSVNSWVCIKAECARLGVPAECRQCGGDGEVWPSPENKQAYEDWQRTPPPTGDGYQIWETVSEGSPISPPFSTPEDLARYMATTKWGADPGTPYETWLAFIRGPGWAPSLVTENGRVMDGVTASVANGE